MYNKFKELNKSITQCKKCPRLVKFIKKNFYRKKKAKPRRNILGETSNWIW